MLKVTVAQVMAWRPGWNPVVKVAWVAKDGRRHWSNTRLGAAIDMAHRARAKGYEPTITIKHNGTDRKVVGWKE